MLADTVQPHIAASDLVIQLRDDAFDFSFRNTAGTEVFRVDSDGALVVNELGADADTRFEGATDTTLLFLDAGTDRVGIGDGTPTYKLDVDGDIRIQASAGAGTRSNFLYFANGDANQGRIYLDGAEVLTFRSDDAGHQWLSGVTVIATLGATGDMQIDGDLRVDGGQIGITGDLDIITLAANSCIVAGTLSVSGSNKIKLGSVTDAGMVATNGNERDLIYNESDSKPYVCTVTGTPGTWVALY